MCPPLPLSPWVALPPWVTLSLSINLMQIARTQRMERGPRHYVCPSTAIRLRFLKLPALMCMIWGGRRGVPWFWTLSLPLKTALTLS